MTTTIERIRVGGPGITLCAFLAGFATPLYAEQCSSQGSSPEGLAVDHYGNLWIAYYDTGNLISFDVGENAYFNANECGEYPCPPFTATSSFISTASYFPAVNGPTRISFGASNFYVTNTGGNTVTVYYDPFAIVEEGVQPLQATVSGLHRPLGAAADAGGNLYVAENATSQITVFTSDYVKVGSLSLDAAGNRFTAPGALAVNGSFLYVATAAGPVYKYSASDFFSSALISSLYPLFGPLPTPLAVYDDSTSSGPTGITFDSTGTVYISYYYTNDVVAYKPGGPVLMRITEGIYQPEGIAYDPNNGYVYVSNSGASNITAYAGGIYKGALTFTCP